MYLKNTCEVTFVTLVLAVRVTYMYKMRYIKYIYFKNLSADIRHSVSLSDMNTPLHHQRLNFLDPPSERTALVGSI